MIYGVEPDGYWDDEPESVTEAREEQEREDARAQQREEEIDDMAVAKEEAEWGRSEEDDA